ncbi:MAG TPA: lycopene cyclase domain-containing protein [Frankiaceae bacterium]|nr:lycopene cyclase domain-containing protein [Frankiaceae bacterium]
MRHLIYVAVLVFCLIGTAPLELMLRTRVYRRPLRLVLTLLPVVVVFVAWDVYAIARHHWTYDGRQTTGVVLPGRLPLDELLFFLVIPICAVLTLEAVRAVKGWTVGDEAAGDGAAANEAVEKRRDPV